MEPKTQEHLHPIKDQFFRLFFVCIRWKGTRVLDKITRCKKLRGAVWLVVGIDPNTINVTTLRSLSPNHQGVIFAEKILQSYEKCWKLTTNVSNTRIFNCFDNLMKWSKGAPLQRYLLFKGGVMWVMTLTQGWMLLISRLVTQRFYLKCFRWFPGNPYLLFATFPNNPFCHRLVGRDGSDFFWLTADKTGAQQPVWSPELESRLCCDIWW